MLFEGNIAPKIFCPYFRSYRNVLCSVLVAGENNESSCSSLSQSHTVLSFQDFVKQDTTTAIRSSALMCHFGATLAVI